MHVRIEDKGIKIIQILFGTSLVLRSNTEAIDRKIRDIRV
jgi:hypothetical protein